MNTKSIISSSQFFLIFLLFSARLLAQDTDWSKDVYEIDKIYPGSVTKVSGEVVEGYIEAQPRGYESMLDRNNQTRVLFYTGLKNKKSKVVYKPEDLKGYKIADKEYKTINYSGGLLAKPQRFLMKKKDGHISTYVWWSLDDMKPTEEGYVYGKRQWKSTEVFQKGDEKPVTIDKFALRFANNFSEYISDATDISTKVANKDKGYRLLSIYEIIDEYNKWYDANKK